MILEPKQTTLAYRCPSCGAGVMSVVDLFKLSADMVKLKCDCGNSEMTIVYNKNGKVRLTVPCILCPNPHNFTVNTSIFFGKDLFVLPCPYSDINICMMGNMDHVKAELSRTELELLDILEKSGLGSFESLKAQNENDITDPQILEIITYIVKEFDEEGNIECLCPDGEEGDYELEFCEDGVRVTCKKCGASTVIAATSLIDAHEFLNADKLILK